MSLLPIFLKLDGRPASWSAPARSRSTKLAACSKRASGFASSRPRPTLRSASLAAEGKLDWIERSFQSSDLDGTLHRHCRHGRS